MHLPFVHTIKSGETIDDLQKILYFRINVALSVCKTYLFLKKKRKSRVRTRRFLFLNDILYKKQLHT